MQAGTTLLRLKSAAVTAGAGNPLVATGELAGAVALSLVGLLAPLLAAAAVVVVVGILAGRAGRRLRERRSARPA